jgi:PAS domain S-box-containing protein
MRDVDHRHLGALPTMIRKVLNVRESLDRQNAHLQISERRYLELVGALPDIVYTLDPSGNFIYVNASVESLGYRPEELIGRHFSAIVDEADVPKVSRSHVLPRLKDTSPDVSPQLFDERRTGSRMTRNLEIRLRVKPSLDADDATASVHAFGEVSSVGFSLPEYDGQGIGTVGIIRDVTLRRHTEEQLREAVRVKEVLLKEVHHRVKNNLQIVSSLLNLQAAAIHDEAALSVFRDSQSQIQSMAIVHEQLYRSENLQTISMDRFLDTLLRHLFHAWDIGEGTIGVDFSVEPLSLGIDQAMPIALIVNELISNAIKHGTQREGSRIRVLLAPRGEAEYALTVADNGEGLPEDFAQRSRDTLGFQLVQSLVQQLDARLELAVDGGASFTIVFSPDSGRRNFDTIPR